MGLFRNNVRVTSYNPQTLLSTVFIRNYFLVGFSAGDIFKTLANETVNICKPRCLLGKWENMFFF